MTNPQYIIPGDTLQDVKTGELVEVTNVHQGVIQYHGKTSEGWVRVAEVEQFYKVMNV